MSDQLQDYSHLRFFKPPQNTLQIGHIVPNVQLFDNEITYSLHQFLNPSLLLVLVSTSCKSCLDALDALDLYLTKYPSSNVVLLVDGSPNDLMFIREEFTKTGIHVFNYPKKKVDKELGVKLLPWSYGINRSGQVITSYGCSNFEFLEMTMNPFRKVTESV